MKKNIVNKILILFFLGLSRPVISQNNEIILWDNIPGAIQTIDYQEQATLDKDVVLNSIRKVVQPTLTSFLADSKIANETAVVIGLGVEETNANWPKACEK